jgi:hypothetical protein
MWQVQQNGHTIVLAAHIDDFVIACADRTTLDKFVTRNDRVWLFHTLNSANTFSALNRHTWLRRNTCSDTFEALIILASIITVTLCILTSSGLC